MDENKISVIVPVYKVEKYIDRCIESIVNQTYANLEIILVDDGSPDNCPAMCDEWAKKDSRIKVIHKENGGQSSARNAGIDVFTGDYAICVDSDDWLELDMLEFLLKLSLKYNADISRCGFYFNSEKGNEVRENDDESIRIYDCDERIIDLLISDYGGVPWNKLYKGNILKRHLYNNDDGVSEDFMHNFRIFKDAQKSVYCDIPKYHYFKRKDSAINNDSFGYGAFDIVKAKKKILDEFTDNDKIFPYAVKGYITSAFIILNGCIRHNKYYDEQKMLIKSILKYRKIIYTGKMYSKKCKLKTFLIHFMPGIYRMLVRSVK